MKHLPALLLIAVSLLASLCSMACIALFDVDAKLLFELLVVLTFSAFGLYAWQVSGESSE